MILTNFCNWKQQLPTEFIEEAEIEQNQNIKLKKRKIKKRPDKIHTIPER